VLRYEGPESPDKLAPGTFLGTFVTPGSGGLNSPFGVIFGPDGNGDGPQDLYVSTWLAHGTDFKAKKGTSAVLRYDGLTGAFIDAIAPFGGPGMDNPGYIAFSETNPTSLAYTGSTKGTNAFFIPVLSMSGTGGAIGSFTFDSPATLAVSNGTFSDNRAVGGTGNTSGLIVGTGVGGRMANDSGATATVTGSKFTGNLALSDGVYFASGGIVCLDLFTSMDITANSASTSNKDAFGVFDIC
jgi:hypothetical protein